MSEFDFAYYLDQRQLLLLLSLIDQRPVCGIPSAGVGNHQDWQAVALSLLTDRRLHYQDGDLVMDPQLGRLLLAMKEAKYALAPHGRKVKEFFRILYMGTIVVYAEFFPDGGCRLGRGPMPSLSSLAGAGVLPRYPAPEALAVRLEENKSLQELLSRWETQEISIDDPPARWEEKAHVCGLVERLFPQGGRDRWIWVEDPLAGLVLHQDRNGIQAQFDTQSCRQSLAHTWGMEG